MNWFSVFLTAAQDEAQTKGWMDMVDAVDLILIATLLCCGIYAVYTVIRLRRNYYLESNKILYPTDCAPDTCLDPDGYIEYILPRLTVVGIAMLLQSALLAVSTFVLKLNDGWVDVLMTLPIAAIFAYYIIVMKKAAKRFWNV